VPFNWDFRSLVYQRAKNIEAKKPLGTEFIGAQRKWQVGIDFIDFSHETLTTISGRILIL
jgi:hypothetical protein